MQRKEGREKGEHVRILYSIWSMCIYQRCTDYPMCIYQPYMGNLREPRERVPSKRRAFGKKRRAF